MSSNTKLQVPADVLAGCLFDALVQTPIEWDERLQIDTDMTSPVAQKARLYQFAAVLLAVLNAEQNDAAFSPVRVGLERRFFPATYAEGAEQLDDVKRAMKDLTELIQPDGHHRPLSWAARWFSGVGVQRDNPESLMIFVLRWPDHFLAAARTLDAANPIVEVAR